MASSSSDDEDEAMAGLSLKNGRASTRGGLLGSELAQLDIPPNARLSGVTMSVEEDRTKVWIHTRYWVTGIKRGWGGTHRRTRLATSRAW